MPNWIYCSPMVRLHMSVECDLLGASDMEHEFSNECRARSEGKPPDLCVGIQEYSTIPVPELNERREGRHQALLGVRGAFGPVAGVAHSGGRASAGRRGSHHRAGADLGFV